jgi:hypothetical protein
VPGGGQRVADGHGGPQAGHDGDDDEEEPGHAIIVAYIRKIPMCVDIHEVP